MVVETGRVAKALEEKVELFVATLRLSFDNCSISLAFAQRIGIAANNIYTVELAIAHLILIICSTPISSLPNVYFSMGTYLEKYLN